MMNGEINKKKRIAIRKKEQNRALETAKWDFTLVNFALLCYSGNIRKSSPRRSPRREREIMSGDKVRRE